MAKLTPKQEALLEYANEADDRYRAAKLSARKRAEELVKQEIAKFEAARDQAVYEAIEAGVPKRRVGLDALKTSSPNTVQQIYNRFVEAQATAEVQVAERVVPEFEWSAVLTHPVSGLKFAFLQVDDGHETVDPDGIMTGSGYLYFNPGDGWRPNPEDKPKIPAQEWAEANPPRED